MCGVFGVFCLFFFNLTMRGLGGGEGKKIGTLL